VSAHADAPSAAEVPTVADCLAVLEHAYPPGWAESWDAVGLSVGERQVPVQRVLFAVDPTREVAEEARDYGAQLLITHHPLFLRGVHGVPTDTPGGAVVQTLIRAGCALYTAHTNADVARPGVSDALADALGVLDVEPIESSAADELDKIVVFVPEKSREAVLDAMAGAGAGSIGEYDRCAWWGEGTGTFRPGDGASPAIGKVGRVEEVAEVRLEMVAPRRRRAAIVSAMRTAHPYEEPAFDVIPLAVPTDRGLGRIGRLAAPLRLADFAATVSAALPSTAAGVRVAGDPERTVKRVAVCGGTGGSLAGAAARAGADVLVTADGRHHYVLDAVAETGIALIDVAHWASEWPWLERAAARLVDGLRAQGRTVATAVSGRVTDPWRLHLP
jgi:dinuclear metal center YbgI/SA1388 family protein